jgi:Zn-dependent protease
MIQLNLVLMLFNLIPIPPLDGSHFFALFFPELENPNFQIYGIVILLAIIFLGGNLLTNIINLLTRLLIGV